MAMHDRADALDVIMAIGLIMALVMSGYNHQQRLDMIEDRTATALQVEAQIQAQILVIEKLTARLEELRTR